jgi:hypothetical protein
LILKILLLSRKGQFGEKSEKEIAIFLIFALMLLGFKKTISYHLYKLLDTLNDHEVVLLEPRGVL